MRKFVLYLKKKIPHHDFVTVTLSFFVEKNQNPKVTEQVIIDLLVYSNGDWQKQVYTSAVCVCADRLQLTMYILIQWLGVDSIINLLLPLAFFLEAGFVNLGHGSMKL